MSKTRTALHLLHRQQLRESLTPRIALIAGLHASLAVLAALFGRFAPLARR